MRCRRCDYPLWNLSARACPECGEAFRPSEFEFRASAVEFRCPHCQQKYFGTGERGQLEPPVFSCVSCSRTINMDEMVLSPAEGIEPDQATLDSQPWIHRERIGFWRAWWRTAIMGAVSPHRLASVTPHDADLAPAWRYTSFNHFLVVGVAGGAYTLFVAVVFILIGLAAGGGAGGWGALAVMFVTLLVMFFVLYLISLLSIAVWIGLSHLILKITGGAPRPMRATALAILYTSGAYILNLAPCLNYVTWLWWPITAGIALKDFQGVRMWRAVVAAVTPPVVSVAIFVAAYMAFFAWAMTLPGAVGGVNAVNSQNTLAWAHTGLATHESSAGRLPPHAIEMIVDGQLGAQAVIHPATLTTLADVPVGDLSLAEFNALAFDQRRDRATELIDELPDALLAHRLGDLVFTYHGVSTSTDFNLWIAILSPDPDANPGAESIDGQIWALLSSGSVLSFDESAFEPALEAQNALRAQHDLAPLPHPSDVLHDRPALSP